MPPKENPERDCEECIHFFACSRQCGEQMAQRSATGCECYETVKSIAAARLIERLTAENAKVEAERDAIIEQIKERHDCLDCKHNDFCEYDGAIVFDCMNCVQEGCPCAGCIDSSRWEWRGSPEAPEGGMMKGASNFDKLCHQVFDGKNDGTNYLAWETDICCGRCGHKLHVYYCEERLYLIECAVCGTKALTKAGNVVFAAYKTLAHTPKIEEDEK